MNNRKRILIFNGYYTPAKKYGGPLTSCKNVVRTCSDKFDIYIIARNHDFGSKKVFPDLHKGWKMIDGAKIKYIGAQELNYDKPALRALFEEVKPDLIWFAGILVPKIRLKTIALGKDLHIPVLLSPRGELNEDRICIKGWKKKPYLFLTKLFGYYKETFYHATSDEEVIGLKKYVGAPTDRIFLVPNVGAPLEPIRSDYIKRRGELRVVFISRIHMVKNLELAIEAVCKMKSYVFFDIYGPLEQPAYLEKCMEIVKSAPDNVTVKYRGQIDPTEVGEFLRKYDCSLFPTINENYGHSIVESLANGVPVVLSKNTTPWDSLDKEAGYVCSLNDVGAFTDALEKIATLDSDDYDTLQNGVREYYRKVLDRDDAIGGHKNMFNTIINSYRQK